MYANCAEASRVGSPSLFGADTVARLDAVRDAYDPTDVFRANYAID